MNCGIVDLGSNTIRLSIYQWEGAHFRLLLNKKTMAGLASYVENGALSTAGIALAGRALASYQDLLRNFDVNALYVFATASLRNITNTTQATNAIFQQTGIAVEVVSGEVEAQLAFRGAVGPNGVSSGLLTDIGGGSFELVAYQDMRITSECSCPAGSLSTYTKFVEGLFPTPEERRAIKNHVLAEIEKSPTAGQSYSHLYGVGGTVRAIFKLAADMLHKEPGFQTLTATELKEVYRQLKVADKAAMGQILHTVPDRVHTILPGFVILNTIMKAHNVESVTASPSGVREGYLMSRVMGLHQG